MPSSGKSRDEGEEVIGRKEKKRQVEKRLKGCSSEVKQVMLLEDQPIYAVHSGEWVSL